MFEVPCAVSGAPRGPLHGGFSVAPGRGSGTAVACWLPRGDGSSLSLPRGTVLRAGLGVAALASAHGRPAGEQLQIAITVLALAGRTL